MQFKHPEILFALLLLLIPIFIHLFQLRRFQKVDFTNVAFLKKVTMQTRKSSQLKKWLTLLLRLLALACIIFAFAQPFTASRTALNTKKETVIYIDNSFSMQAKGAKGPLLQRALQDLFKNTTSNEKLSWFTNNRERKNTSLQDFKNEVLTIKYAQNQLPPSQVILKAKQLFSDEKGVFKRLIYISDFQLTENLPEIPENLNLSAVQLKPIKASNIVIDSAYVTSKNAAITQLNVSVSNRGDDAQEAPMSLFNNGKLIAKTAVDFSESVQNTVVFDVDYSEGFSGKLSLNEQNLPFDNTLFFSLNKTPKIKVLAINEADGNFLQRLFDKTEFQFSQQSFKSLNYSDISEQNFIVLNELNEIPASLTNALNAFNEAGGSILIIPAVEADISSYNNFLSQLNMGRLVQKIEQEKKISKIVFSHPLFKDVFEKKVTNFQNPTVNSFYNVSSNATAAISLEDGRPFVLQNAKTYLFSAAISKENSNFLNSPLVVPTIYNMSQLSLPLPHLYYNLGRENTFAIAVELGPDEILTLKDSAYQFIPLQQTKASHVLITTEDEPATAGNYQVMMQKVFLESTSYNYSRKESELQYLNAEDWNGAQLYQSIDSLFESIAEDNAINSFWKWFVIFALLFLIFEMLVLKFFK